MYVVAIAQYSGKCYCDLTIMILFYSGSSGKSHLDKLM